MPLRQLTYDKRNYLVWHNAVADLNYFSIQLKATKVVPNLSGRENTD